MPPPQEGVHVREAPLDFAAIRELYINNSHYEFSTFARNLNFNPQTSLSKWKKLYGVDFEDWQRTWTQRQQELHALEVAPKVVEVRKKIMLARIDYVENWTQRTKAMRHLLDTLIKNHVEDAAHDRDKALEIRAGRTKKRSTLDESALSNLAIAAQRIQELELKSMLIVADNPAHEHPTDAQVQNPDQPGAAEYRVLTMGQQGFTAEESAKFLGKWFDQSESNEEERLSQAAPLEGADDAAPQ